MEFQFPPTPTSEERWQTPPALAAWSFQLQPTLPGSIEVIYPPILMVPHFSSLTAAFQLHFYLWFKTYRRRPLLIGPDAQSVLHQVLGEVCARQEYHLLDTDIDKDNVRLLLSLKPAQSISETVRFLKGNVSRQFGLQLSDQLKASDSRSVWAHGYFARSSGKTNIDAARAYVDSQARHHGYRGDWIKPLKFRNPNFKSPSFKFDHLVAILDYHLVIATQNRLPLFDESMAPELFNYIITIGRKHNFAIDRIGLLPDHMHLIIEAVPSLSVQDCVLALLENTRFWMTTHYSGVLKQMNGWDVWQPSFYAGTVGEYSTAQVREFLRM